MTPDAWRGARVLVTGASGFIGSHVLARLESEGAVVLPLPGRKLTAELIEARALGRFVAELEPSIVLHLAAEIRRDATPTDHFHGNVELTAALLDACKELPSLRRFVHVGTCGEYGSAPSPLREDGPCRPIDIYGESRHEATLMALDAHRRMGVPVVVARPFLTYGPGQRAPLLMPDLFRAAVLGSELGLTDGGQERDVVYVADVVEALLILAHNDEALGQIVNVGSGIPRTVRAIASAIATAAGTAEPPYRWGARPYRPREPMTFYADVARQKRLIGFAERTPLGEGIAATIAWWRRAA